MEASVLVFFRVCALPYGGDTVSTGVKTRRMHAELH